MNDLLNTRFISLLAEPSQKVTNEEMSNAYGKFTEQVKTVGCSDNATVLRTLNVTRIELAVLETYHQYEQGEKCPEISVFAQSLIFS